MVYTLSVISCIVMFSYILWTSIYFKPQISLSRTYFVIPWKPLFTLVMVLAGFTMLPRALDIVPGEFKLIPFLGVAGMILVGCSPNLDDKEEARVHLFGAIASALFSQLWIILYTNVQIALLFWAFPISLLVYCIIKRKPKSFSELDKRLDELRFTFWTEIICYIILYIGLLHV